MIKIINNLQLFTQHQWLVLLLLAWTLPWKAVALWRAVKKHQHKWFIGLLLVNTLGILEIFYLFCFQNKKGSRAKARGSYIFSKKAIAKTHFTAEEAKLIGEKLGIDWSKFDIEQFKTGMNTELEHGLRDLQTNVTNDDPLTTGKIALAHLKELPDYYTRLEKMEK